MIENKYGYVVESLRFQIHEQNRRLFSQSGCGGHLELSCVLWVNLAAHTHWNHLQCHSSHTLESLAVSQLTHTGITCSVTAHTHWNHLQCHRRTLMWLTYCMFHVMWITYCMFHVMWFTYCMFHVMWLTYCMFHVMWLTYCMFNVMWLTYCMFHVMWLTYWMFHCD